MKSSLIVNTIIAVVALGLGYLLSKTKESPPPEAEIIIKSHSPSRDLETKLALEQIRSRVEKLVKENQLVRTEMPARKREAEAEYRAKYPDPDSLFARAAQAAINNEHNKRKIAWHQHTSKEMLLIGSDCFDLRKKYPDDQQLKNEILQMLAPLDVFKEQWD